MKAIARSGFIAGLLALTGCMVGPNYHPPDQSLPVAYSESVEEGTLEDEQLIGWWKQFQDPLLDALIEEAVQSNYDWQIALEQICEARARYRIQRSYLWPEIDLNAAATRSRFSNNLFTSSSSSNSTSSGSSPSSVVSGNNFPIAGSIQNFFQVGFDAVWELDFFGKFRRSKRAAYDLWQASSDMAHNVLLMTISEVARSYVAVRALQAQIDLLNKQIALDERDLQLTCALLDAGLGSQIPLENVIASLESDCARLPVLQTSLKQTIYGLAYLLGKEPEGFTATFNQPATIPAGAWKIPPGLPCELLRRRPDIRSAERQLAAATEQIGVAVADLFPHISLTGSTYGYESNKQYNWLVAPSRYWNIGPSINWNLIDFGRSRAQIAVQNSLQKQALLTYEQTVIGALQDVEGALVAYFEEQKRLYDLTAESEAEKRALELTKTLFQAGLIAEGQVLTAEKNWLEAQNNCLLSQQAVTGDLIALYKALGGDWECFSSP